MSLEVKFSFQGRTLKLDSEADDAAIQWLCLSPNFRQLNIHQVELKSFEKISTTGLAILKETFPQLKEVVVTHSYDPRVIPQKRLVRILGWILPLENRSYDRECLQIEVEKWQELFPDLTVRLDRGR